MKKLLILTTAGLLAMSASAYADGHLQVATAGKENAAQSSNASAAGFGPEGNGRENQSANSGNENGNGKSNQSARAVKD